MASGKKLKKLRCITSIALVEFLGCPERSSDQTNATNPRTSRRSWRTLGTGIVTVGALEEEDFETEEFHFEYNNELSRPRIYNDMITLRSGDHMIKLAISHAIAQSTKLSFFEEAMAEQMDTAKDVPTRLAKTGELGMTRGEVIKLLGGLFKSRVDVNLSSNVLDVPNLIWEDELIESEY